MFSLFLFFFLCLHHPSSFPESLTLLPKPSTSLPPSLPAILPAQSWPSSSFSSDRMSCCIMDVIVRLASRYLLLNEAKTEAINHVPQPCLLPIDICGPNVITSANICDLGMHLDSTLSMTANVSHICRTAYAQLRCIANTICSHA